MLINLFSTLSNHLINSYPTISIHNKPNNSVGVLFGILSSVTTAVHSLIIKASLPIVNDSALALAWYTNLLSAIVVAFMVPFEMGAVVEMLNDQVQSRTFFLGSIVTVSGFLP